MTRHAAVVDHKTAEDLIARALTDPRQEFGSFFLSRLLGFRISFEDERCIVAFEVSKAFYNPQGTLHGGILATAMDTAMGHLLQRTTGPGATLAMTVHFLAPIASGEVRCEASLLRKGRSISVLQCNAYGADGTLAAHATANWRLRSSK
jgi:uncharacterized protein (TIGR00369 family)